MRNSNFLKPSPYVEISVDGNSPRKTETVKNTAQPKWNETFTLLVTPQSKINFVVFDRNNFRKDTPVGEKKVELFQILTHFSGRCDNLELTLDLINENKQSESPAKVGELICVFQGLNVDMSKFLKPGPSTAAIPLAQNNSDGNVQNRSVFNGIRAKVRSSGIENIVPPPAPGVSATGSRLSTSERRTSRSNTNIPPQSPTTVAIPNGTVGPPATVPNGNAVQVENEDGRPEEPLPPGWEMRFDTYGRRYYVDHNNR